MLNIRLHWALVSSKWWWCDSTGCSSDLFKVQKVWRGEIYHEARFKMRRDILFRQFPVAGNVLRRILTRDLPDCKHTNPKTDRKSTNQRNITQQNNPHLSQDESSNLWWDVMTNNNRACFDLLPKSSYVLTCNKLFDFCRSRDLNSWSTTNQGCGHQDNNCYENSIYSSWFFQGTC